MKYQQPVVIAVPAIRAIHSGSSKPMSNQPDSRNNVLPTTGAYEADE